MPPDDERDERKGDELIDEDEDLLGSLGDEQKEAEAPPPATWAARQAQGAESPEGEKEAGPGEDSEESEAPARDDEGEDEGEGTVEYDVLAEEAVSDETASEEASEEQEVVAEPQEPEETSTKAVEEGPEEGEEEPETEEEPEAEAAAEPEPEPEPEPLPAPPAGAVALTPAEGGVPPGMVDLPGPDPALDDDLHPPKAGLWPRFLAASLVIVLSMAAATSTSLLLYATDIASGLSAKLPGVRPKLATVEGGGPQTILILGSDIRPEIEDVGRSDTTMLLRLDPERDLMALLSLPRDLKVNIPGHGVDRLNLAYALGGPKLTLQTVKDLTGLRINHLVNVDFAGFAKAVNAIDCVYVDVDRNYFNSNVGVFGDALYAEIDVDAGYQRLCGQDALDYVRYRHEDNDIVRAARQQDFLREARAKVPPGELWSERRNLIKIFTDYTTSDIDDAGPLIEVMKLFIELRDAGVRKVSFEADIGGPGELYVTASDRQVQRAVRQFLGEGGGGGAPSPAKKKGGGGGGGGKPALIDVSSQAATYGSQFARERSFPIYAPTKLAPGSSYDDDSHVYGVDISKKEGFGSYKLVFKRTGPYGVPEHYGLMGTRWLDPPILDNPSEVRKIGGREYMLFYDGNRLRLVAWKTDLASYWLNNTLSQTLGEDEMLAIVKSMKEF